MLRFAVLFFVLLIQTNIYGQASLNVPSTNYPTIQSAIIAAVPGDTVLVAPGIYVENLIFPAKDFQLLGVGAAFSIIDLGTPGYTNILWMISR